MKLLIHSSATLCLLGALSACGGDGDSSEPASTNVNSFDRSAVLLNADANVDRTSGTESSFDQVERSILPGGFTEGPPQAEPTGRAVEQNPRGSTDNARSSQGIANGGNARRDDVRVPRRNEVSPQRIMIENREIRNYDGSGNNVDSPEWGSTFVQLKRLGEANYSDGTSSMIFTDRSGPREISNTIVNQAAGEDIINSHGASDFS